MTKTVVAPAPATRARRCFACGKGTIRRTNLRGLTLSYRDEPDLLVTQDIELPRCDACGEMPLKSSETRRLSALLEGLRTARKRATVTKFIAFAESTFPDVPRYEWEQAFGLSTGYLSRLLTTRLMDTPLEILLSGIAAKPYEALQLLSLTRALPPTLSSKLSDMALR